MFYKRLYIVTLMAAVTASLSGQDANSTPRATASGITVNGPFWNGASVTYKWNLASDPSATSDTWSYAVSPAFFGSMTVPSDFAGTAVIAPVFDPSVAGTSPAPVYRLVCPTTFPTCTFETGIGVNETGLSTNTWPARYAGSMKLVTTQGWDSLANGPGSNTCCGFFPTRQLPAALRLRVIDSLTNGTVSDQAFTGNLSWTNERASAQTKASVTFTGKQSGDLVSAGTLYAVSELANAVYAFDLGSGALLHTAALPTQPEGVALDPAGNVYVVQYSGDVIKLAPDLSNQTLYARLPIEGGYFGIAFDLEGNLYVGALLNGTIRKYPPGGGSTPIGILATVPIPRALHFDAAHNRLLVAFNDPTRTGSGGVTVISDLKTLNQTPRTTSLGLHDARGITTDPSGNAFVTVSNLPLGEKAGAVVAVSNLASLVNGMSGPNFLAFSSSGNLYVAAYSANTIEVIGYDGSVLPALSTAVARPVGLAISPRVLSGPSGFSVSSTNASVFLGSSASSTLSVVPFGGFKGNVTFGTLTGWPAGFSGAVSSLNGVTKVNIDVRPPAAPGTYALPVTATTGTVTVRDTVLVSVTAPAFHFTSRTLTQTWDDPGQTSCHLIATITVVPDLGFTAPVALSSPNGIFTPARVSAADNWTSTATLPGSTCSTANLTGETVTASSGALSWKGVVADLPLAADVTGTVVNIASVPAGRTVLVDGIAVSTPRAFSWIPGSTHSLDVPSPQANGSTRYVFDSWSSGVGGKSQTIVVPNTAWTLTASFTTQFQLSTSVTPLNGGAATLSPAAADGFYTQNGRVTLTANASPGFVFANFSGDLTGSSNPQTLVMDAAKALSVNFNTSSSLVAQPPSLVFRAPTGSVSAPQSLRITSSSQSILDAAASTNQSWIQLNASGTATPLTLSVSVDTTGLQPGTTYMGLILLRSASANNSPLPIEVSLSVDPMIVDPSTFVLDQTQIGLTYKVGSPAPAVVNVKLTSSGPTVIPFRADSNANWLLVNNATSFSGSTPMTLPLALDVSKLSPGPQKGQITVSPTAGNAPSVTISVSVQVIGAVGVILVENPQVTIAIPAGSAPVQQIISLSNVGGPVTVSVSAKGGDGWLAVPATYQSVVVLSTQKQGVLVVVDPSSLKPNTYQARIELVGDNGQTEVVPVTLAVSLSDFRVDAVPGVMSMVAAAGAEVYTSLSLVVSGAPGSAWSASSSVPWLTVGVPSGDTLATSGSFQAGQVVVLTVLAKAPQSIGVIDGLITITIPGAANSPLTLKAGLDVRPANSVGPAISPAGMVFQGTASQTQPIQLINRNGVSQKFTAAFNPDPTAPADIDSRLTLTPLSGTLSATVFNPVGTSSIQVSANLTGLAPGAYSAGNVNINFPGNVQRSVAVLLLVPTSASNRQTASGTTACSTIRPVLTSSETSQALIFGDAVDTQVALYDNCGELRSGLAVAGNFDNGDHAIGLTPLFGGVYRSAWQPQNEKQSSISMGIVAGDADALSVIPNVVNVAASSSGDSPAISRGGIGLPNYTGLVQLAPGSVFQINGRRLADGPMGPATGTWPPIQGVTQVLLGGQAIPLQYVSPGTIYAQIPYAGVPTNTTQQLIVKRGDRVSAPETIVIAPQFAILVPNSLSRAANGYSVRAVGLGEVEDLSPQPGAAVHRKYRTKHPVTVLYRTAGENDWKEGVTLWSGLAPDRVGEYEVIFEAPGLVEWNSEFQLVNDRAPTRDNASVAMRLPK